MLYSLVNVHDVIQWHCLSSNFFSSRATHLTTNPWTPTLLSLVRRTYASIWSMRYQKIFFAANDVPHSYLVTLSSCGRPCFHALIATPARRCRPMRQAWFNAYSNTFTIMIIFIHTRIPSKTIYIFKISNKSWNLPVNDTQKFICFTSLIHRLILDYLVFLLISTELHILCYAFSVKLLFAWNFHFFESNWHHVEHCMPIRSLVHFLWT